MTKKILFSALSLCVFTSLSTQAQAAGFYLQEQSVSGVGSAFAGQTAMPRDASIISFNPAGMTYLDGENGSIGIHVLKPRSDVDNDGTVTAVFGGYEDSQNPYGIEAVPNGAYSHQMSDKLWLGVSVTAPFGLSNEYDDDWFARFDSVSTSLRVFDVQPSVAYKVNDKLSVGGGVNVQYADANLYAVAGTGHSRLEGDDVSFGYNFGLMYDIDDATRFGLHYKSQVNHKLDGKITLESTGSPYDGVNPGVANLNLPEIASVGLTHQLNDEWTVMGGASWFGWSNFERITATTDSGVQLQDQAQNYKDTWAFNIGAEYQYSEDWTLRGGVQFDQTPTQDGYRTTRTPDGDRTWISLGATYAMNEKMSLDMAATYIDIAEEKLSLTRTPSQIEGTTSGNVGIISLGLNYKF